MAGTSTRMRLRASMSASSPRARRKRNIVSYEENSSNCSESDAALRQSDIPQTPQSRTRQRHTRVSYCEDSANSDVANNDALSQDELAAPTSSSQTHRKQITSSRSKPSTKAKKRKAPPSGRKNVTLGAKRQKNVSHQVIRGKQEIGQNGTAWKGKPMPWSTLPYHVWLSVFNYASFPLVSTTFDPMPSISWLLRVASVCKAFLEPALTALYYEPPIYSTRQITRLGTLLLQQDERSAINYRVKVKHLSIDSMMSSVMRDDFMVKTIPYLTQLQGIALGVHLDDPKLCRLHTRAPTGNGYMSSPSIYSVLESTQTQLKNWTWNRTIDAHFLPLSAIKDVHQSQPFQSLASLTFVDFHMPETVEYQGRQTRGEEAVSDTLSALPSLRKLQFSLADIVNERLVPLLPSNLQTLVLTSCYNLFSPALIEFLHAKGHQIKELVLSHNQSLNLSFLTRLSEACPRLEILKMDLLYYNSHTTFNDSSPRYDSLLGAGEQPSWPMSLRHLELLQLRKWKTPAAELFFSSFVDSPGSLPNLRHMEIKASIDESSWRDRIAFRDKWVRQLKEVYLRKSAPPNPHWNSIAGYQKWKSQQKSTSIRTATEDSPIKSARRIPNSNSNGSAVPATTQNSQSDDSVDNDVPLMKVRRSARTKTQSKVTYIESDDSDRRSMSLHRQRRVRGLEDYSKEDSSLEAGDTSVPTRRQQRATDEACYVQGLCSFVDIVIDNLRPAEEQLHERDFLDDERSGDEDWNGDDDMDDGRYAW